MTGWIFLSVAVVALGAFVYAVGKLAPRRERYEGSCATGISPVGALDQVEAAIRALDGYTALRGENELTITRRAAADPSQPLAEAVEDVLHVRATRADIGTIVDISGYAEPEVIAAVRDALARTSAWTEAV